MWVRISHFKAFTLMVNNEFLMLLFFWAQWAIIPFVETILWRKARSVMWATMMKTSAASVQSSLLEFGVTSNLGKCAGTPPPNTYTNLTHLVLLLRVLVLLIWFYASVQVRACAADKTVDLSQQLRPVMRRQTVREPACVQVCPPTVLSREPRRTSRCAVWGRGSAWTGYLSINHSVRYCTIKPSFTETRPEFN